MPLKNHNAILFGIAAVLTGVIFYCYWNFVYSPIETAIQAERKSSQDLTQKLTVAKARASQLSRVQAEMAGLQIDVAELEKLLPKTRELPSLLRVLTHRAESNGIMLNNIQPQKPVAKGLYDEVPYVLSVTASVHGLAHFFTAMGKGERLFAARNLTLNASPNKADPTKTITANFTLIAFKYHE